MSISSPADIPDICVIGSGPGGAIPAVALAEKGYKVLILEAGTATTDDDATPFINNMQIGGETDMRFGFSRQIGGATNLWAGRLATFEEIDFEPRPDIPHDGWPLNRASLDLYYKKAADILGLGAAYNPSGKAALPGDFSKLEGLENKRFFCMSPPFNAGTYLKDALRRLSALRLESGVRALRLNCNPEGTRILSVETVNEGTGEKSRIEAGLFIVAAGGLETPRLLMNSGKAAGQGAENVGRYFSTHPKADMAVLHLNKGMPLSFPLFTDNTPEDGIGRERHGLGLSAQTQRDCGILNHYVQLFPLMEFKATRLFEKIKGSAVLKSQFLDKNAVMKGLLPALGLFIYEMIGRLAGLQKKTRIFMLRGFLDQIPNPENRVQLSAQTDRHGLPKVDVSWHFSAEDRKNTLDFFARLDEYFRRAGLGYVEYAKMKDMTDWPLVGIHSHFMGTTRMGKAPERSVTDGDARVHGVENLYISGPSLFPTYGYANPVFTIAALGLRLADHIGQNKQSL